MKKIIIFYLFPLFLTAQTATESLAPPQWLTNYDVALEQAKKENKKILLYFTGSDWCPPCIMLKKDFFDTTEFAEASKSFIIVYVDLPRNRDLLSSDQRLHNKKLVARYNKKSVFPLLTILNTKGKVLDEYSGYAMNGNVRYHLKLLKKNS